MAAIVPQIAAIVAEVARVATRVALVAFEFLRVVPGLGLVTVFTILLQLGSIGPGFAMIGAHLARVLTHFTTILAYVLTGSCADCASQHRRREPHHPLHPLHGILPCRIVPAIRWLAE